MARFAVVRRERMVEPKGVKIARPGNGPGPGGQELSKIAVERIHRRRHTVQEEAAIMIEPPKCPTLKCPGRRNPMPLAASRPYDKARHATHYACPTCAHETTMRTA